MGQGNLRLPEGRYAARDGLTASGGTLVAGALVHWQRGNGSLRRWTGSGCDGENSAGICQQ